MNLYKLVLEYESKQHRVVESYKMSNVMNLYLLKLDFDVNIISYENCKTRDSNNLKYYITTSGIFFFNNKKDSDAQRLVDAYGPRIQPGQLECVIDMDYKFENVMIYNNIYKKLKGILRDDSLTELGI